MSVKRATTADLDGSNWCFEVERLSHLGRRPEVLAVAVPQWVIIYILLGFAHAENPPAALSLDG